MERVDAFVQTETAKYMGLQSRPDFFEAVTLLFLAQYDKELEGIKKFIDMDKDKIKLIVKNQDKLLDALFGSDNKKQ